MFFLREQVKEVFLDLGAELCGIAHVDSFADAPKGFHPTDIYKDCKSVVVFAKAIPKGTAFVSPRIIYNHFNELGPIELDRMAYTAATRIEQLFDAIVVPVPADSPYDYWDSENMEGRGTLSMKHAAALSGIGTLGKSTLLLNAQYGNRLSIGAVLTNMDLTSDEPAEKVCMESCQICIDSCPVNAISENGVNQKLCRNNTYSANDRGFGITKCNNCRTKCPMALGKK